MSTQYKRYSADRKAKVSVEASRGQKTANEMAVEQGVHPRRDVPSGRTIPSLSWRA